MLLMTAGVRTPLNGVICVEYFAICAFVITVEPPFVIALTIVASGSGTLSRFGPIWPTAPAALSVWQAEHVLMKTALPAFALPTSFGVALRWARADGASSAAASASAATPTPVRLRIVERSIQNLRWLTAGCALGL